VLLVGKCCCIKKEKQGRGKIKKESNNDPEFFGIIYIYHGWVFDLLIQEYNAIYYN